MDTLAPSPSPYASRQASPSLLSRESYVVNGGSNPDIIPSSSNGNSNSGTASAPRSLALKISRLLSTSLEDAGTRTALETLDEFGLADGDNDAETATTKTSRGNAAEGKSARTRRLRAEIDRRLLADSNRFLVAFKDVNDKLAQLQSHLTSMHGVVDGVEAQLATANSGTKHLLASAASLRAERLATADKQAIVTVFLRRFTLTESEVQALTSREVLVGKEVFDAIARTEEIREDCRVLMSGDAVEEAKAGMEVMLVTSQHLDGAFNKLHRYAASAARNYTSRPEVLDNVSPTLRQALQLLKVNRNDLFEDVLNLLSNTRSSALSSMFIEALTRGHDPAASNKGRDTREAARSGSAAARPIELHAHDPIRYVGDILAWVHQAMAGEREFLENLFGMKDSGRLVGQARPSLSVYAPPNSTASPTAMESLSGVTLSDEARLRSLLDKNLEGCGRPLRTRIQQTIKSNLLISAITTYQVFQLLQFYRVLMRKVMGVQAGLCQTLTDLATFANRAFFDTIEDQGRSLLRNIQPPSVDLRPPLAVRDALSTLREVLMVHKQSLLDEEDRGELDDFEAVLEAALAPVIELVDRMKGMKPQEAEACIFDCNCIVQIQQSLEPYPEFSAKRMSSLEARLKSLLDKLITTHYATLVQESGLSSVLAALEPNIDQTSPPQALSSKAAASSEQISSASRVFDSFLRHIDTLSSPRLTLLTSHKLAIEVHQAALSKLEASYRRLFSTVSDPTNQYPPNILHRSPDEVRMLLLAN